MLKALNVSHRNIIEKIKKYLLLNNRDQAFIKKFDIGYCNGISALWVFTKWLQTQDKTDTKLLQTQNENENENENEPDDYTWFQSTVKSIVEWDETEQSLQSDNKPSKLALNFEQFIAKIEFFQNTNDYLFVGQGDLDRRIDKQTVVASDSINAVEGDPEESILSYYTTINSKVTNIDKEYAIAALFTMKQLEQLLSTPGIIQDHKLIMISSFDHMTALFKDKDNYFYFDPNSPIGEIKLSSISRIAQLIFRWQGFNESRPTPFGFTMFCFGEKAKYPDVKQVLSVIKPESKATKKYANGVSGLQIASKINSLDSVQYYLDLNKKINIDEKDDNGITALMFAAMRGHLTVVQELIQRNTNITAKNHKGVTALMYAAYFGHLTVVQEILKQKPNTIKDTEDNGNTILMYAVQSGNLALVEELIQKENNIAVKNHKGLTALMCAATNGHLVVAQEILKRNPESIKDKDNGDNTVLMYAALSNNSAVVQEILKQKPDSIEERNEDDLTALMLAYMNNNFITARKLIEFGANINAETGDYSMTVLMLVTEKNNYKAVKEIIAAQANIDQKDKNDWTALMIAAEKGSTEVVCELIAAHAKLEERDKFGYTALMIAVLNNNIKIVDELIKGGAKLDAENGQNKTAFMLAVEVHNQDIITLLENAINKCNLAGIRQGVF